MKHAYCIICHGEPQVLSALVEMLDDYRNDIFLMVDSKTDINLFRNIKTEKAGLFFADRVDVRWGDLSLVKAEFAVFEAAYRHGRYGRYHLLSGVDMPIKSQDYIHRFFDDNPLIECIGFAQGDFNRDDLKYKAEHYFLFMPWMKHKNLFVRKLANIVNRLSLLCQDKLRIKRNFKFDLKKGTQWCSITECLCEYILSKRQEVLSMFRFVACADEIYKQTLVWNSDFKDKVYDLGDEYGSCMRAIDWKRGNPYCWGQNGGGKNDLIILRDSRALFARKFSSEEMWIVEGIKKHLENR